MSKSCRASWLERFSPVIECGRLLHYHSSCHHHNQSLDSNDISSQGAFASSSVRGDVGGIRKIQFFTRMRSSPKNHPFGSNLYKHKNYVEAQKGGPERRHGNLHMKWYLRECGWQSSINTARLPLDDAQDGCNKYFSFAPALFARCLFIRISKWALNTQCGNIVKWCMRFGVGGREDIPPSYYLHWGNFHIFGIKATLYKFPTIFPIEFIPLAYRFCESIKG